MFISHTFISNLRCFFPNLMCFQKWFSLKLCRLWFLGFLVVGITVATAHSSSSSCALLQLYLMSSAHCSWLPEFPHFEEPWKWMISRLLSKKPQAVLSLNEDFGALQGRELELISRHLYLDSIVGSLLTQIYPPTHSYGQFFTAKVQSLR